LSVLGYGYLYSLPNIPKQAIYQYLKESIFYLMFKGIHIYLDWEGIHIYLIHSILVGTYIYLFILFLSFFKYLTPHKLSEGCLEWCSFICVVFGSGVRCLAFELVLTCGVIL
jgi:hypothetical protein